MRLVMVVIAAQRIKASQDGRGGRGADLAGSGACWGGDVSQALEELVEVDESFDGADVAFEVAGIAIGPGQGVRSDLGVVLGGAELAIAEPGLQLE